MYLWNLHLFSFDKEQFLMSPKVPGEKEKLPGWRWCIIITNPLWPGREEQGSIADSHLPVSHAPLWVPAMEKNLRETQQQGQLRYSLNTQTSQNTGLSVEGLGAGDLEGKWDMSSLLCHSTHWDSPLPSSTPVAWNTPLCWNQTRFYITKENVYQHLGGTQHLSLFLKKVL